MDYDAVAESGRNSVSKDPVSKDKHYYQIDDSALVWRMNRLTRDGTAEPCLARTLRRERGQGNIVFPCSADHEQDWLPHPVYPYSAISDK